MNDKYPCIRYTIHLEYAVHTTEDETYKTTVTAVDEEAAIEKAWNEMYEREGRISDDVDENNAVVVEERSIPARGCEDDQTLELFSKEKKTNNAAGACVSTESSVAHFCN